MGGGESSIRHRSSILHANANASTLTCRKSGTVLVGGTCSPSRLKKGTTSSRGPRNTMRPCDSTCRAGMMKEACAGNAGQRYVRTHVSRSHAHTSLPLCTAAAPGAPLPAARRTHHDVIKAVVHLGAGLQQRHKHGGLHAGRVRDDTYRKCK